MSVQPNAAKLAHKASEVELLREILTARASEEDLASYKAAELDRAAALALAALNQHRPGESVVVVEPNPGIEREGRAVTVVTVVNDNMPFLFDSVMGEITDDAPEPTLVTHPVFFVQHGKEGVTQVLGEAAQKPARDASKVSLIQVHLPRLSADACERLEGRLSRTLAQVRAAVADWKPMLARLDQEVTRLRYTAVPLEKNEVHEAIAFLEWLRDDNFIFLGMREFNYKGGEKEGTLERSEKKGLGILADPEVRVLRRGDDVVATTPEIRAFLHGPEPLIVTKANAKSVVHRRAYLDYIGIKTFDDDGKLSGELRIVGLFASTAYTSSVLKIPYLRSKAQAVIARSGFAPTDHSGKALINVLESFPRDELFQIGVSRLRKHAEAILALGERPRVRVLYRIDQFDRFVSVLVFVPRDRYDSLVRERIGAYLKTAFEGRLSAFYPSFPEGSLARVHFIIGRSGGKTPRIAAEELESAVRAIVRTWDDALRDAVEDEGADDDIAEIAARFPEDYRNSFAPPTALFDAKHVSELSAEHPIAIDFHRRSEQRKNQAALKIYHFGSPVALSRRVPLLENMGFRVISERTFDLGKTGGKQVFLHDMELESAFGEAIDLSDDGALFDEVFLAVWGGEQDNDRLNALTQQARLGAAQIGVLRAYSRYLHQVGISQSQGFIADTLNRYPAIAGKLFALFVERFDPRRAFGENAEVNARGIEQEIGDALEAVHSLDDDMIIRRFLNLIRSTLRTNYFAESGRRALAFKFDSRLVQGLPQPRPWREIFVYGPEVEGVHLRFGPVARGGLRWSDRAQDYRTEVLGLVKAQQVKNSVIVPVGAKGGFYPRRLPAGGDRQQVFEAGRQAYINFVSTLLSITDNLRGDEIVPPENVACHDGADPYFVVAADKGTATFSDTANEISQAHDFWLDDAFASGGSAGYDHKKMGITARGAWEAVKRHFREMNRDIQTEPFTVVGVGDMSGDVFGNGMLLSPCIRLVAAFDHRDIFIDPDPDPAVSFAERRRLFELSRSSWQDYDKSKLSNGGMIIPRSQKRITLSAEAAKAIGMSGQTGSPAEIIAAILRAPVDLLWFGGIGTYVRASDESNQEVGDRANDGIRVTAKEVGARVVGEGANLGVTQRARIEFNRRGGRCNSDAVDNSGGVNSSDLEVNIKIALAGALRNGALTRPDRNELLAAMTDEVADLVLQNNHMQTLAISLVERRGLSELPHQARMMTVFESQGHLDRAVEFLPGPEALAERQSRGEPLTRAEIGVLLAYAKIVLFDELVASPLPDERHFEADLFAYFPARMREKYAAEIRGHRLRREIIATELANDIIDRGGPAFVTRLQDMTGRPAHEVVEAYAVVRDGFDLRSVFLAIDALDNKIYGQVQLTLYEQVSRLILTATAWQLKNGLGQGTIDDRIRHLVEARAKLEPALPSLLPPFRVEAIAATIAKHEAAGVPSPLAERLSLLEISALLPDIVLAADTAKVDLPKAAGAFFAVSEAFRLSRIESAAASLSPSDYYDGLALARAMDTIDAARRGITIAALSGFGETDDAAARWIEAGGERVARVRERLQALTDAGEASVARLTVAAGLLADLSA
ncbi:MULTISPECIES: NAD-glutamate dehydrogenase [Chelativorans]|jgi:glutamate dehydrogenase|uniref:Glutamate dehydrogenase (NAD) n=1 Tax=Chelativorans sp. (strain BNC1) TaxID=266779 RepID=Q11CT2_CHESB|nr:MULTISPECIES: NAD-glutamate dehydrogenase [Chelativorans]